MEITEYQRDDILKLRRKIDEMTAAFFTLRRQAYRSQLDRNEVLELAVRFVGNQPREPWDHDLVGLEEFRKRIADNPPQRLYRERTLVILDDPKDEQQQERTQRAMSAYLAENKPPLWQRVRDLLRGRR